MKIDVASGQIQGKRDYQQDGFGERNILPLSNNHKLLFLADGMGGYKGGEKASELVIKTFMLKEPSSSNQKSGEFLSELLLQSNREIAQYKESHPDVSSMGTTLVALSIVNDSCQWISVGDSPLYRIRDNNIKRINENHSVAGLLDLQVKNGEISRKEANTNPNRHMLTSALTGEELSMINLSSPLEIKDKDIFILASDGIETLTEEEILRLVNSSNGNMEIAVSDILNEIENKNKNNQDNATLMIVSISKDNSIQSTFAPQQDDYDNQKLTYNGGKKSKILPIIITLLLVLVILIGVVIGMTSPSPEVEDNQTKDFKNLHKELINKVDSNSSYVQKINDININKCLDSNKTCILDKIKELEKLEKDIENWVERENNLTKLSVGIIDIDNITIRLLNDINVTLMKIDDGNFSTFDNNITNLEKEIFKKKKNREQVRINYINKNKKCIEKLKDTKSGDDNTPLYKEQLVDIENNLKKEESNSSKIDEIKNRIDVLVKDTNCSDKKD